MFSCTMISSRTPAGAFIDPVRRDKIICYLGRSRSIVTLVPWFLERNDVEGKVFNVFAADLTLGMAQQRAAQIAGHLAPQGLLVGQVAIITGSGQGIGAEAARLFAKEGAKVVVQDIDGGNVALHRMLNRGSMLIMDPRNSQSPIRRRQNHPSWRKRYRCAG